MKGHTKKLDGLLGKEEPSGADAGTMTLDEKNQAQASSSSHAKEDTLQLLVCDMQCASAAAMC